METANPRYGRIERGDTIPYGTLASASYELKQAYYTYGVRDDKDWPELPVLEPEVEDVSPEEHVWKAEMAQQVCDALDLISPKRATILRMRHGIGCPEMSLEEIGQRFGVSRERIRQLEIEAMRLLKHPLRHPVLYKFRILGLGW